MRTKSTLSGERVKNAPEFHQTMIYAGLLGRASKIGSQVYKSLPEKSRKADLYKTITGKAMKMLKNGMEENDIIDFLLSCQ